MEHRYLRYFILAVFAFIAQLIDGGIGMGYGVSLTSFLLSVGFGSAMSSAVVHLSEIFTTLVSGASHFYFGNFDRRIFKYLAIPGVIGGAFGAFFAVKYQNSDVIKPFVSSILLLLGILIVIKYILKKDFLEKEYITPRRNHLIPLGFIASFVDAIGGGGWGPISTPVLVMSNTDPKKAIGSVNFAEFFVTLSISITFLISMPKIEWDIVLALIIGGIIAAPLAAAITKDYHIR
ncbi:MAG: sulfite exporter TauE/SafE family protein [Saprospiraceae bacterium]|nr:sulfite exporter TauE/SafE family protein [Saprospiraceae bacterium]